MFVCLFLSVQLAKVSLSTAARTKETTSLVDVLRAKNHVHHSCGSVGALWA